jgi:hypothetical protein
MAWYDTYTVWGDTPVHPLFENLVAAIIFDAIEWKPTVYKTLDKESVNNNFTFQLWQETDTDVFEDTASIGSTTVDIPEQEFEVIWDTPIEFTAPGTYRFLIREDIVDGNDIIYDDTVFGAVVKVIENVDDPTILEIDSEEYFIVTEE